MPAIHSAGDPYLITAYENLGAGAQVAPPFTSAKWDVNPEVIRLYRIG